MAVFGSHCRLLTRFSGNYFAHEARKALGGVTLCEPGRRHLFSDIALGMDIYTERRANILENTDDQIRDSFIEKMKKYVDNNSPSIIFRDDVMTMLNVAETEEDLQLVEKIIKRNHYQQKEKLVPLLPLGTMVMRMLHHLRKPELAQKFFLQEELDGYFHEEKGFFVMIDLLYKCGEYQSVLDCLQYFNEKRQKENCKFLNRVATLGVASCYKLNTPESLSMVFEIKENTKMPPRFWNMKNAVVGSLLALNQGKPETALEIIEDYKRSTYSGEHTHVTNVEVLTHIRLGNLSEAASKFLSFLPKDVPYPRMNAVFREVATELIETISNSHEKSLLAQVQQTLNNLEELGLIEEDTLDDIASKEIPPRKRTMGPPKSRRIPDKPRRAYSICVNKQ